MHSTNWVVYCSDLILRIHLHMQIDAITRSNQFTYNETNSYLPNRSLSPHSLPRHFVSLSPNLLPLKNMAYFVNAPLMLSEWYVSDFLVFFRIIGNCRDLLTNVGLWLLISNSLCRIKNDFPTNFRFYIGTHFLTCDCT